MEPKYKEIEVQLTGMNGNAFGVLGAMSRSLRSNGINEDEIESFNDEATSGDYNHLLRTCMIWVTVK